MGFIPKNAKWYLADLVVEIRIEGRKSPVIDVGTRLVRADSPEEAYKKAMKLGAEENVSFLNTKGKKVKFKFRGLSDLDVIHEKLEHGAEIRYSQSLSGGEAQIKKLVSNKKALSVFAPITPSKIPNYVPQELEDDLKKMGIKF